MSNITPTAAVRRSPLRIVVLAAVLVAASVLAVVLMANPLNRPQPGVRAAAAATTSTTQTSGGSLARAPVAAAPVAPAESFVCGASVFSNPSAPLVAAVDGVRTGSHSGFDRLTVQFSGAQPAAIEAQPRAGTMFIRSPLGDSVSLAGRDGLLLIIRGADAHTAYSGSRDITTGHDGLAEVRVLEDFEGQVQLGLGLTAPACYHVSILSNPTRLVVDIKTS